MRLGRDWQLWSGGICSEPAESRLGASGGGALKRLGSVALRRTIDGGATGEHKERETSSWKTPSEPL